MNEVSFKGETWNYLNLTKGGKFGLLVAWRQVTFHTCRPSPLWLDSVNLVVSYPGSEKCHNSVLVILDCGLPLGHRPYARKRVSSDGGWPFLSLSLPLGPWRASLFDPFEGLSPKVSWCCEAPYWCDWPRFFITSWREILMRMSSRWNDHALLRSTLSIFLALIVTFGLCKSSRRTFHVVCSLSLRCRTSLRALKLALEDLTSFL